MDILYATQILHNADGTVTIEKINTVLNKVVSTYIYTPAGK